MSLESRFELILLLMACVIGLELLARRLRLPPAAAFVVGGIVLALIPGVPEFALDPDLALVLFLPPLLMASAYYTTWRDFRANLRIILQLAIGAVAFTTLIVGVVTHLMLPALPWAACFALGAIVSPPDAVAAKAVLQQVRLPPRLVVLLEGESLVNDATGLVLYRVAVAAALTGTFSLGHAVLGFAVLSVGGVLAGLVFGYATSVAIGRIKDPSVAITGSLLAAWGSYIIGEAIGVSGVLSTVACGILVGWRQHAFLSATNRLEGNMVWKTIVYIMESFVFILIGLGLRSVLQRLGDAEGGTAAALAKLVAPGMAVIAAVVVSRLGWIFPAVYLPRLLIPALRRREPPVPVGVPLVMGWAGMRGVVSLAAALALPAGFPGRDFILVATFAVILVTVLVQGTTLGPLIRAVRLKIDSRPAENLLPEAIARLRMTTAQLAAIQALSAQQDGTQRHPRLVEQYGYRARAAENYSRDEEHLSVFKREHFTAILATVAAGRAELLRLHRAGEIHDSVLKSLERDLDLEEIHARGMVRESG